VERARLSAGLREIRAAGTNSATSVSGYPLCPTIRSPVGLWRSDWERSFHPCPRSWVMGPLGPSGCKSGGISGCCGESFVLYNSSVITKHSQRFSFEILPPLCFTDAPDTSLRSKNLLICIFLSQCHPTFEIPYPLHFATVYVNRSCTVHYPPSGPIKYVTRCWSYKPLCAGFRGLANIFAIPYTCHMARAITHCTLLKITISPATPSP